MCVGGGTLMGEVEGGGEIENGENECFSRLGGVKE